MCDILFELPILEYFYNANKYNVKKIYKNRNNLLSSLNNLNFSLNI